jgi:hypothetical protein
LMNYNSQPISKYYADQETLTLSKEISALELISTNNGARSGKITPVPKGACLQVCGYGFNERTIQVHWEGRICYVFLQDVEPMEVFDKPLRG